MVFGPIISRRFGISLGVDLSPNIKQCNYNCVYCELKASKTVSRQYEVLEVDAILEQIKKTLKNNSQIDVLTFSANGEPTLYPHLEELILESKKILKDYKHIKTLILSNGSRFSECANALKHFDIVKFSIDSIDLKNFKKVDKPNKELSLEQIKKGIVEFSKIYKGDLIAEILIVKDINDDLQSNRQTADFLRQINIKRLDLSTIDRPSSHRVFPVSNQKLYELGALFDGINVCIVVRKHDKEVLKQQELNENGIIELIKRRPLSKLDSEILLTKDSLHNLNNLINKRTIKIKNIAGLDFYCI